MEKPRRHWFVYICSISWDIISWIVILVMWLLWGEKLEWSEGLWFRLKPGSWPARTWYRYKVDGEFVLNQPENWEVHGKYLTWGGSCLGHAGFLGPGYGGGPGIDTRVERHEHVHTEQFEVSMMISFVINALVIMTDIFSGVDPNWILHLVLWCCGWIIFYFCGGVVAWLRGENFYIGNTFEESAYSQEDDEYSIGGFIDDVRTSLVDFGDAIRTTFKNKE